MDTIAFHSRVPLQWKAIALKVIALSGIRQLQPRHLPPLAPTSVWQEQSAWRLRAIATAEDWRKQGIGSGLLEHYFPDHPYEIIDCSTAAIYP